MKKTVLPVGDPHTACSILGYESRISAGDCANGNEPIILQVTDAVKRGDPDSPAIILKERLQPTSWHSTIGNHSHCCRTTRRACCAASAVDRNLPASPFAQAIRTREPNASVSGR